MKLELSPLGHTWLLDLDGSIVKHNGYQIDGQDSLLEGAKEFLAQIPPEDCIVFVTSCTQEQAEATQAFLAQEGISYHEIVYGLPYGERIVLNDQKPSGLHTAIALNPKRDQVIDLQVSINPDL